MTTADDYVQDPGIPRPFNKDCGQTEVHEHMNDDTWNIFFLINGYGGEKLLPQPFSPHPGHSYIKGQQYLAIAMSQAEMTEEEVIAALDKLVIGVAKPRLEELEESIMPEVRVRRRKLYSAHGKRIWNRISCKANVTGPGRHEVVFLIARKRTQIEWCY